MLKNYLKIAWRNIIKNSFYSLVNIVGLAAGIAFTLLTGVYVWQQTQVNHQLKNFHNQYIILSKWKDPNMGYEICTSAELPKALKQTYPQLVANYYHWDGVSSTVSKGDQHFREQIAIGDSALLNMYGFKVLYGNANTALNEPYNVVITDRLALKYFGRTDVTGQMLNIENFTGSRHDFVITAVIENPARNSVSSATPDNDNQIFLPATADKFMGRNLSGWDNVAVGGFIELKAGVKPDDLIMPMRRLIKANAQPQLADNMAPYLVPLDEYYLTANNGVVKKMIYTLSGIAGFILLMAVINFINLCVSRSSTRMKEMGIRKVLGGMRAQLIRQFLTESIMLVLLSTILALLCYVVCRPYFISILGDIPGLLALPLTVYACIFTGAIVIGILAGIYPALVLTSLKSVDSLKGKLAVKEHLWLRKSLASFQFGVAAVVIVSAYVISQQVGLFFSKDLGYNKDYIVYSSVPRNWSKAGAQQMETVRDLVVKLPEVAEATLAWEVPNGQNGGQVQIYKQGAAGNNALSAQQLMSDQHYQQTFTIPMLAGKYFSSQYTPADSDKVVLNATAVKALGWTKPEAAIGEKINQAGVPYPLTVAGVTADYHFNSMHERLPPLMTRHLSAYGFYRFLVIKLKPGSLTQHLATLQHNWEKLLPGTPFDYKFMDDALAKLYRTEIQLKKASYIATTLAIIIAFLGVLGLISLSIQKRTKEVGIRKVLGSSVAAIIGLFVREFLTIVIMATVIACPLAYLLMQHWLSDYVYRINITASPFVLAIVLLTAITALLIALQTLKAALTNPVKSLRTE